MVPRTNPTKKKSRQEAPNSSGGTRIVHFKCRAGDGEVHDEEDHDDDDDDDDGSS